MADNSKKSNNKSILSWDLNDYETAGEVPPECVYLGKTEGELLDEEGVAFWVEEELRCLSVIKERYPKKFEEQYQYYILDLEYLHSLGKITNEELLKLKKKENFNFGQE